MTDFRRLAPHVLVSVQISAADVTVAKVGGVTRIINNRPDGEDPDQPTSAEIESAARSAGLDYVHIPIVGLPGPEQVAAVDAALGAGGSTLMYCRSGMRSTAAWALATSTSSRMSGDEIRATAAAAGYDLSRLPL